MRPFLGHEELARIRALRSQGKLDLAEKLLVRAEPSPAVLDELRKIASVRARQAKKVGDWQAVVQHLEGYNAYAKKCRKHCIATVNQAPPPHTKTDVALLLEAKKRLSLPASPAHGESCGPVRIGWVRCDRAATTACARKGE